MGIINKSIIIVMVLATYCVMFAPVNAMEYGVDRPGGDYKDFKIKNTPIKNAPNYCRSACMGEPACKAWTFVRPGYQGPTARCWLKNTVPAPKKDPCCVSGVKQVTSIEYGIDRPGMDYKNFNINNDPLICQNSCITEANCRAWTFVRPGYHGPSARCWLKNAVPTAKKASCCVSGVKK